MGGRCLWHGEQQKQAKGGEKKGQRRVKKSRAWDSENEKRLQRGTEQVEWKAAKWRAGEFGEGGVTRGAVLDLKEWTEGGQDSGGAT